MDKRTRGWLVTLSGTFILATVYGTVVNCFSLFIIPACEAYGFSRGGLGFAITLIYFGYMVGSILSAGIYRKFDLKTLMVLSAVLIPLLYLIVSFSSSIVVWYLVFATVGFLLPFVSFQAYAVLIHDWVEESRQGTAVGLAFMGSGIGGMIMNIVVAGWIQNHSIGYALRATGLLMAVTSIPVALLVVKPCHENYGISHITPRKGSFFIPGAYRLYVLAFFIGISITFMSQSIPPHLVDQGYSAMYGARMNSLFMLFLCLAKFIMGYLFDRLGVKKTMYLTLCCGIGGALSFLFARFQFLHVGMVVGAGISVALGSVAYPVLSRFMLEEEYYASGAGNTQAASMLGSSLAPFLLNVLYDMNGSYNMGYMISITLFLIAFVLVPRKGRH